MKFIRTDYWRSSKLGKNRKKLQVWRRAKGRHSKIRRRRKGYPAMPVIGYRTEKKGRDKIDNLDPILVHNLKDLENVPKNSIIIIARIGAKKKMTILKRAEEKRLKIANLGGKK
jgi:large subunit ribosomal protein L32e